MECEEFMGELVPLYYYCTKCTKPKTEENTTGVGSTAQPKMQRLNDDALEKIVRCTLRMYPQTRQNLRAVSRLFKEIVDNTPLHTIYLPHLAHVKQTINVEQIVERTGEASGAILRLQKILHSTQISMFTLRIVPLPFGWFSITHITSRNY